MTLIELMIGVLVASLLVGFVFDIHNRMSAAYRSQTNIGGLQQGIRAAVELVAHDARVAGYMMPDGVRLSSNFPAGGTTANLVQSDGDGNFVRALTVFNNPDGMTSTRMQPDSIHMFYADPFAQAVVVDTDFSDRTSAEVDSEGNFQIGDLVVFSNGPQRVEHEISGLPETITYNACLVKLTSITAGRLEFSASAPFNTSTNNHCFISGKRALATKAQVFRVVARAYRIDTSRPVVAAMEMSQTGGLLDDWQEMGMGFVDLQISQRYVEGPASSDLADPDGDGNDRMDWYADPAAATSIPTGARLTQLGIAVVARTMRPVDGVRADSVPVLTTGVTDHNPLGDAEGPKDITQPEYEGDHIFRQASTIVDVRNIGIAY